MLDDDSSEFLTKIVDILARLHDTSVQRGEPLLASLIAIAKGEAEDTAIVLSTSEQAQTPTGTYHDALLTRDTTPLEPELVELKWYAPGVGPVLTLTPAGEQTREQLVEAPGG